MINGWQKQRIKRSEAVNHRCSFQSAKLQFDKKSECKSDAAFLSLLKMYVVGTQMNRLTEAVLLSTHNICFG